MIGRGLPTPAPTTERSVKLSLHSAPEQPGLCHKHYWRRLLNRVRLVNAPLEVNTLFGHLAFSTSPRTPA
jgi:hypothetical protein